jgi:magnesium transporter
VITNAVSLDPARAEVTVHPVSIIATDRVLICLVESTKAFQPAQLLLNKESHLAAGGVEAALQLVIGAVINTYEMAVSWLESSTDDLADIMFEERPLDRPEQLHAFKLRTALSQVRRLTDPMRAVMTDLVDSPPPPIKGKAARGSTAGRRWRLLAEQHHRVANAADALREALSSVFDTSLALADVRMNQTMKKLSGWAAIIAVPTLVTSFVGMNVGFPLTGTVAGFWIYLVIMVAAGLILYFAFRRRDWI